MIKFLCLSVLVLSLMISCNTGVNRSDDPGIVKIIIQSNPSDTSIVILENTYSVDTSSVFNFHIFEGRVYVDSFYSDLTPSLDDYIDEGRFYNVLEQEDNVYKKFTIYETYAPPDDYTKIQFGLTVKTVKIGEFITPVIIPADEDLLVDIEYNFSVRENRTTEILLQIDPLKSIVRYRDSFLLERKFEVVNVRQY